MQSSRAVPGNPWPHDMVVEVEDAPQAVLDLLWLREACRLDPVGVDLPPLLEVAPAGPPVHGPDAERRRVWRAAWPIVWDEVLEHAGRPQQGERFQRLLEPPFASSDRATLLREFIGPTWRDRFGDEVFDDDGYRDWIAADAERQLSRQLEYERSPERIALPALIPAWEAGLAKVVTIPVRGAFTRVVGPAALLVATATRDDPDAYRAALATFVDDVPRS